MTEIERKALALVRECESDYEALCRAIEQHEAFRQEVSDAVEEIAKAWGTADPAWGYLRRFIIPKTDPLVEALNDLYPETSGNREYANQLRAAIEARGGRIVWEG